MTAQDAVVVAVLVVRLLVPLVIPRHPLPGIVASLVLDAADQTLFQAVGAGGDVANYQSYDKALDVYYLTVAYVSTLRNWVDPGALAVARFLFYYRLIGVVAFESTGERVLLVVFPNTFEYFFIFYEVVRRFWNPRRLGTKRVVAAAAAIWVAIKLPQEWWIHIARLDVTEIVSDYDWVLPAVAVALAGLVTLGARLARRLPAPDRRPPVGADQQIAGSPGGAVNPPTDVHAVFSVAVLEKILLISMVVVIFSQVLPDVRATGLELATGVTVVVVLNSIISLWQVRRGTRWASTLIQFVATLALNFGIVVATSTLLGDGSGAPFGVRSALFFLLLISLIVALYDRYRVIGDQTRRRAPRVRPEVSGRHR